MRYLKIPNDKNKKSCDQNDETFWSHDLTKIEIAFEISCGDVDSLVIFVIFEREELKIENMVDDFLPLSVQLQIHSMTC